MALKTIIVTGGAGYIGAHVVRELIKQAYRVIVIDNLSAGRQENVPDGAVLMIGDCGDSTLLTKVFDEFKPDAVIHMAASIEVGESVDHPIEYLDNNTIRTERLLKTMIAQGITNLIFSSTAAVYGLQETMPITEDVHTGPLDPYGYSKLLSENVIQYYGKFAGLRAIIFRYFNACGSDFDKTIYSSHESHLIPIVMDAVSGKRTSVMIYGDDYNTIDGTGVRDYVHVLDIARAHVVGLEHILLQKQSVEIFNIGTGEGQSVKEVIAATEQITGKTVPIEITARRHGDSPITVADNAKIKQQLGFELHYSNIKTIVETSLR